MLVYEITYVYVMLFILYILSKFSKYYVTVYSLVLYNGIWHFATKVLVMFLYIHCFCFMQPTESKSGHQRNICVNCSTFSCLWNYANVHYYAYMRTINFGNKEPFLHFTTDNLEKDLPNMKLHFILFSTQWILFCITLFTDV